MSTSMNTVRRITLVAGSALALTLGGCTYDYMQTSDRVGYHAGDAVKANLEAQTVNPTKDSMYDKSGLGANGDQTSSAVTSGDSAAPSP